MDPGRKETPTSPPTLLVPVTVLDDQEFVITPKLVPTRPPVCVSLPVTAPVAKDESILGSPCARPTRPPVFARPCTEPLADEETICPLNCKPTRPPVASAAFVTSPVA